jgi:hypothetical protein
MLTIRHFHGRGFDSGEGSRLKTLGFRLGP